jgi:hypothetical protein
MTLIRLTLIAAAINMGAQLIGASQTSAAESSTACSYLSSSMDAQSSGPLFLASFPTVKSGPLQGAAFLYDKAVATIALVACNKTEKAARIGDAILAALNRDRYWHDGRLRNGYLAGPIGPGPVRSCQGGGTPSKICGLRIATKLAATAAIWPGRSWPCWRSTADWGSPLPRWRGAYRQLGQTMARQRQARRIYRRYLRS